MMRNMLTLLPSGKLWMGDPRVGTPSADCAGIATDVAAEYSGHLIRVYVTDGPEGVLYEENGEHDYSGALATVTFDLYVDGVYVDTYGVNIGSSTPGEDTAPLLTGALVDIGHFMNA